MVYPTACSALRFTTPGSDLLILEKDIPPLPADEILVKVHAASINPVDVQLWRSPIVAAVSGDKGIGRDFSGTVVEVGSKVTSWVEGDEIFGLLFHVFGQGTFSTYININPTTDPVARKPSNLTHAQAASIPLAALTAYACLSWLPFLAPSQDTSSQGKVVVRGASGGTGVWLVQLAKVAYNCHVTAICSGKNADFVKNLGADEVIDYTTQDITEALLAKCKNEGQSDLIIDCVGGTELLSSYPTLLHPKGAYLTIVGPKTNPRALGGPVTYLTYPRQILWYLHGLLFGPRYANISFLTSSKYLEEVARLVERGELRTEVQEVIEGVFSEEQGEEGGDGKKGWRRAIEAMEGGRTRGKIVLAVS